LQAIKAITMPEFAALINDLSFTECPRWRDARLYVSDLMSKVEVLNAGLP
jgi:hypothetical protein